MKAIIQRVRRAIVTADGGAAGQIENGMLILLGVGECDNESTADILAAKIINLRIFSDENGKMNRSLSDVGGGALVVSNFTLFADVSHGNRPSFFGAAAPESANTLYEYFIGRLRAAGINIQCGVFGADMQIETVLDGPVTITIDTETSFIKK